MGDSQATWLERELTYTHRRKSWALRLFSTPDRALFSILCLDLLSWGIRHPCISSYSRLLRSLESITSSRPPAARHGPACYCQIGRDIFAYGARKRRTGRTLWPPMARQKRPRAAKSGQAKAGARVSAAAAHPQRQAPKSNRNNDF